MVADRAGDIEPLGEAEEVGDLVDGEPGVRLEEPADEGLVHLGGEFLRNGQLARAAEIQDLAHFLERFRAGAGVLGFLEPILPEFADGRVVVRGECGEAQALVSGTGRHRAGFVALPHRNLEAGDVEGLERGPHIRRHFPEVLGDEAVGAGFLEQDAEEHVALAAVVFAVLGRAVVALGETRQPPAGERLRLIGREVGEARVLVRPPREIPNAEKPERMVDAQQVENRARGLQPAAPPAEIVARHRLPVVEREAPVLPPVLGEGVGLENLLRRGAARAGLVENPGLGPNIGAVNAHADRDVAHEGDAEFVECGADRPPLRDGDPLDIAEKRFLLLEAGALPFVERPLPLACGCGGAVLLGPVVHHLVPAVPNGEGAEKGIVGDPLLLLGKEFFEIPHAAAGGLRFAQVLETRAEGFAFHRLHGGVAHGAVFERGRIVFFRDRRELRIVDVGQPFGPDGKRDRLVGDRAEDIVGAVVRTGLVHGEDLDQPEAFFRSPGGEFHEGLGVADANVVFAADGADGRQDSGDFVVGGEELVGGFHGKFGE